MTEAVAYQMMQGNFDRALQSNVATMYSNLKLYGAQLEALYKDFLDRFAYINLLLLKPFSECLFILSFLDILLSFAMVLKMRD